MTLNTYQYFLYCFARSDYNSDNQSSDEGIIEFSFLVDGVGSPDNFTVELG